MEELKPCPFCGSEDIKILELGKYCPSKTLYEVKCSKCNGGIAHWYTTRRRAVNAWNRRKGEITDKLCTKAKYPFVEVQRCEIKEYSHKATETNTSNDHSSEALEMVKLHEYCDTCKHDIWNTMETCSKCIGFATFDGKPRMYKPKDESQKSCSTCGYSPQTPSCDTCEGYSNWWSLEDELQTDREGK